MSTLSEKGSPHGKTDADSKLPGSPTALSLGQVEDENAIVVEVARDLNATTLQVLEAFEHTRDLSLEELKAKSQYLIKAHSEDPNFPKEGLVRLNQLINDDPSTSDDPDRDLFAHRLTVGLLIGDSPYAEVRAVVDPTDDATLPCSTIRAWVIGMSFVILVSFVNQLFSVRQPSIRLQAPVIQLLSYPVGKAAERWLPDAKIFGHSLNPGVFNKKEHMLISIMAAVGTGLPHSRYIIFTQWLGKYLDQSYAANFWYQILLALAMNLMGFGLAGLCRRFLVYPSFCIWPKSLVTIALNRALHSEDSTPVPGPLNRTYSATRYKVFMLVFVGSFVWFWFPDYIFQAMSFFNWLAWIAPNNFALTAITGVQKGLGVNPLPTFDWNVATYYIDPLIVPFHVTANFFLGAVIGGITIVGLYWTNAYNTAYFPINTNTMFDHFAQQYNVSSILDDKGLLDEAAYEAYSPVYIAASSITMYWYFFAVYSATVSYTVFYHWHDIKLGFRSLVNSFKKRDSGVNTIDFEDIHSKLMKKYPEVSELWYLVLNVISVAFGVAAVAGWPTYTSVGTVFFGIALALVFMIPAGIIFATTGIEVEYNVLAEFIGGAWQPGNALAMNFFKGFGYVTVAHALDFSNDLKLAHYLKLPPRHTFWAQIVAAVVSSLVCVGVMNFQITRIADICESDQAQNFTCPGIESYWTAAVLFGSLGAKKVFGTGGHYVALLSAFPVGLAVPVIVYYATRRLRENHWLRSLHPVVIFTGGHMWSPYNLAYIWPAVLPGWLSMVYVRRRWLAFWSRYNYVLSAALSTGIAIAAVFIFFAVAYHGFEINWWGNSADTGCESDACTLFTLPDDGVTHF